MIVIVLDLHCYMGLSNKFNVIDSYNMYISMKVAQSTCISLQGSCIIETKVLLEAMFTLQPLSLL